MNRLTRAWPVVGLMTAAAILFVTLQRADAQSGTRSGSGTRPGGVAPRQSGSGARPSTGNSTQRPAGREPFEVKFWNWLQSVQYRNWAPLPGQTAGAYAGESPHGAQVKLFANRTAVGDPEALPVGSVLVKENFAEDGRTLMAITVMYRSTAFDPEHGDWFWAKYEPDGQVSQMDGMSVAGRVQMCADCHGNAGGGDYSFANDR